MLGILHKIEILAGNLLKRDSSFLYLTLRIKYIHNKLQDALGIENFCLLVIFALINHLDVENIVYKTKKEI